jgi:hypothetical protein
MKKLCLALGLAAIGLQFSPSALQAESEIAAAEIAAAPDVAAASTAGVGVQLDIGSPGYGYYNDGYIVWYGPGYYYGTWYDDQDDYYRWRRYHYGRYYSYPRYYRHYHNYYRRYGHGGYRGGRRHH